MSFRKDPNKSANIRETVVGNQSIRGDSNQSMRGGENINKSSSRASQTVDRIKNLHSVFQDNTHPIYRDQLWLRDFWCSTLIYLDLRNNGIAPQKVSQALLLTMTLEEEVSLHAEVQ